MDIKLDENLGSVKVVTWLRQAGHDVTTVKEQGLISAPDDELIDVCQGETKCLVTCDRGFGNRLRFNPAEYSGIVIIRLPPRPNFEDFRIAITTLIASLEQGDVTGELWIIQGTILQKYQPLTEEND
jgi:predicted nuclease of predicted toxin-antitoxin system